MRPNTRRRQPCGGVDVRGIINMKRERGRRRRRTALRGYAATSHWSCVSSIPSSWPIVDSDIETDVPSALYTHTHPKRMSQTFRAWVIYHVR